MHHEVTSTRLVLGGRFELIRHLGGGGMSEVYLAEQRSLGRLVALKVLKRHLGEQWVMNERFRREAKLLSSVDHPSVVRVIDFESNETDGTVLVLEYAEGPTLEQTLASGPFDAVRAMRVLKQLAEGLALIHDQGIIHRDIKPQNVILSPTPAGGEQARLLDFGIARLIELHESKPGTGTSAKNDTLSGVGQAVGTPAYVAPEQAMAGAVTPRTDVYAFGVLAFRTLVGRLPFPGPETMDYLKQHVESPPPELLQVAPHLAPWPTLVKLVDACLTKRPESRPRDGRALLEALESAAPPSPIPLTTQTRQVLSAVTTRTLDAVQGSVSTLGQQSWRGARQVAGLALKLDRRTRWSLVLTLLATGLIPVAYAAWPRTAVEEATLLLENGDAEDALQVVDEALPRAPADVPRLLPLKVAALHQLGRFEEGREVVRATPFQALFTAPRPLLEALAEASADFELDPELNAWLHLIPRRELDSVFGKLARGPLSRKQWGALRWLDASGRADELDLVARYVAALASPTCTVRARAARRLGELGDKNAIGALRELSETPKEDGPGGPVACGQDDAADAIRRLKKRG